MQVVYLVRLINKEVMEGTPLNLIVGVIGRALAIHHIRRLYSFSGQSRAQNFTSMEAPANENEKKGKCRASVKLPLPSIFFTAIRRALERSARTRSLDLKDLVKVMSHWWSNSKETKEDITKLQSALSTLPLSTSSEDESENQNQTDKEVLKSHKRRREGSSDKSVEGSDVGNKKKKKDGNGDDEGEKQGSQSSSD